MDFLESKSPVISDPNEETTEPLATLRGLYCRIIGAPRGGVECTGGRCEGCADCHGHDGCNCCYSIPGQEPVENNGKCAYTGSLVIIIVNFMDYVDELNNLNLSIPDIEYILIEIYEAGMDMTELEIEDEDVITVPLDDALSTFSSYLNAHPNSGIIFTL